MTVLKKLRRFLADDGYIILRGSDDGSVLGIMHDAVFNTEIGGWKDSHTIVDYSADEEEFSRWQRSSNVKNFGKNILRPAWIAGIVLVAVWFAGVNVVFTRRLRRSRQRLEVDCPRPVYVSDAVETPCLHGLIAPAVYVTPAVAAVYYTIAIVLFIVCRWTATFLMKYFNPAKMMALFALGAFACSLGVVYLPTETVFSVGKYAFGWNIVCLVAMSGFMSLMFPTIYGIALGGLDSKSVKLGAAGLIMAILGGAIITPWMAGVIGDSSSFFASLVSGFSTEWDENLKLSQTSLRASFFVPAVCFAVVGLYALIFKSNNCR